MKKDTPRVAKLRQLVDAAGGPVAFARSYSQKDADKPIDDTYVSQILNGYRAFGEKAAANMERRSGLPSGYFDGVPAATQLTQEEIEWLSMRKRLSAENRKAVFNLGNTLAQQAEGTNGKQ